MTALKVIVLVCCPAGVVYSGNEQREEVYGAVESYNRRFSTSSAITITLESRDIHVDDTADSVALHKAGRMI